MAHSFGTMTVNLIHIHVMQEKLKQTGGFVSSLAQIQYGVFFIPPSGNLSRHLAVSTSDSRWIRNLNKAHLHTNADVLVLEGCGDKIQLGHLLPMAKDRCAWSAESTKKA